MRSSIKPRLPSAAATLAALLAAATLAASGCGKPETSSMSDPAPRDQPPPDFLLGGIQIHEADLDDWFDALEAQSMNAIQVTEYAHQGDWDTDDLTWGETPRRLLDEIRGASRRGIAVAYVCRVHLDSESERNDFLWHGFISPRTDELVASWFERYGRFVVERAELAEREGVDLFIVGSELNALATTVPAHEPPGLEEYFLNDEKQRERRRQLLAQDAETKRQLAAREGYDSAESYIDARIAREQDWARTTTGGDATDLGAVNARRELLKSHWQALIAKVRSVYSGKIGYAANFDNYDQVGFWPSLDVVGINAYFKLRQRLLADESERHLYPLLVDGWRHALSNIARFRDAHGLGDTPIVFTEMGYTRRARSTLNPWAHDGFALVPGPGEDGTNRDQVVVWREQPEKPEERAWAVRALHQAHSELEQPLLAGVLYWKLSSHDYHLKDEAFMVHVGKGSDDPILAELRRFVGG